MQVQKSWTGTRHGIEILHQCSKGVKTKSQKFLRLISMFVEVTREKLVGGWERGAKSTPHHQ